MSEPHQMFQHMWAIQMEMNFACFGDALTVVCPRLFTSPEDAERNVAAYAAEVVAKSARSGPINLSGMKSYKIIDMHVPLLNLQKETRLEPPGQAGGGSLEDLGGDEH